jgi:hypothetical protein
VLLAEGSEFRLVWFGWFDDCKFFDRMLAIARAARLLLLFELVGLVVFIL